ncbi:MAG: hypothetical protein WA948_11495 [Pontixanthobacter sp.]
MFDADQEVRQRFMARLRANPSQTPQDVAFEMVEGDARRMAQLIELRRDGALNTGGDFYRAAFLYPHGGSADSYL